MANPAVRRLCLSGILLFSVFLQLNADVGTTDPDAMDERERENVFEERTQELVADYDEEANEYPNNDSPLAGRLESHESELAEEDEEDEDEDEEAAHGRFSMLAGKCRPFIRDRKVKIPTCIKLDEVGGKADALRAKCCATEGCTGYVLGSKGDKGKTYNCGKETNSGWSRRFEKVKKLLDTPIPPAKPDPFQGPKSGAASRLCICGDDIHCYPWQGSNFDVQGYAASYTVAKAGNDEVQTKTYVCRTPQAWSGGLSISCVESTWCKKGGQVGVCQKNRSYGKWTVKYSARGLFQVYLNNGVKLAELDGSLCNGKGGQLHKKRGTMGSRNKKMSRGDAFTCRDCYNGVGAIGCLCACQQYMNPTSAQFGTKKPYYSAAQMGRFKVPPQVNKVALAKQLKANIMKCAVGFFQTKLGRLVLRHEKLWKAVAGYSKGCAMDNAAAFKPVKRKPGAGKTNNFGKVVASTCRFVAALVQKGKPDTLLCQIVEECGLKSKACGLEAKKAMWRVWAKRQYFRKPKPGETPKKVLKKKQKLRAKAGLPQKKGQLAAIQGKDVGKSGRRRRGGGGKKLNKKAPPLNKGRRPFKPGRNRGGRQRNIAAKENQEQSAGGKKRGRSRKGAGRGNPKGCKVSESWANKHLKWCPWNSWGSWK